MRLLSEREQAVLRRLAVLPGSFRLGTAAAISADAAEALPALVDHSLAITEHRTGPTRYRLLETVRAVGARRSQTTSAARCRSIGCVYCIDELAVMEASALPPAGLDARSARTSALHVVAAEHALATAQTDLGLRLVHGLFEAWHGVGQRSTLDRWMDRLVAQTGGPSHVRGMVLRRQAIIAQEQLGDYERAMRLLDRAEADALAVSDDHLLGRVRAAHVPASNSTKDGSRGSTACAGRDRLARGSRWRLRRQRPDDAGDAALASRRIRPGGAGARTSPRCEPRLVPRPRADRSGAGVVRPALAGRIDVAADRAARRSTSPNRPAIRTSSRTPSKLPRSPRWPEGKRTRSHAGAVRSHGGVLP